MMNLCTGFHALKLQAGQCPRCEGPLEKLEFNLWRCPACCQGFAIADGPTSSSQPLLTPSLPGPGLPLHEISSQPKS